MRKKYGIVLLLVLVTLLPSCNFYTTYGYSRVDGNMIIIKTYSSNKYKPIFSKEKIVYKEGDTVVATGKFLNEEESAFYFNDIPEQKDVEIIDQITRDVFHYLTFRYKSGSQRYHYVVKPDDFKGALLISSKEKEVLDDITKELRIRFETNQ